jgi:hypothetical protein
VFAARIGGPTGRRASSFGPPPLHPCAAPVSRGWTG